MKESTIKALMSSYLGTAFTTNGVSQQHCEVLIQLMDEQGEIRPDRMDQIEILRGLTPHGPVGKKAWIDQLYSCLISPSSVQEEAKARGARFAVDSMSGGFKGEVPASLLEKPGQLNPDYGQFQDLYSKRDPIMAFSHNKKSDLMADITIEYRGVGTLKLIFKTKLKRPVLYIGGDYDKVLKEIGPAVHQHRLLVEALAQHSSDFIVNPELVVGTLMSDKDRLVLKRLEDFLVERLSLIDKSSKKANHTGANPYEFMVASGRNIKIGLGDHIEGMRSKYWANVDPEEFSLLFGGVSVDVFRSVPNGYVAETMFGKAVLNYIKHGYTTDYTVLEPIAPKKAAMELGLAVSDEVYVGKGTLDIPEPPGNPFYCPDLARRVMDFKRKYVIVGEGPHECYRTLALDINRTTNL